MFAAPHDARLADVLDPPPVDPDVKYGPRTPPPRADSDDIADACLDG